MEVVAVVEVGGSLATLGVEAATSVAALRLRSRARFRMLASADSLFDPGCPHCSHAAPAAMPLMTRRTAVSYSSLAIGAIPAPLPSSRNNVQWKLILYCNAVRGCCAGLCAPRFNLYHRVRVSTASCACTTHVMHGYARLLWQHHRLLTAVTSTGFSGLVDGRNYQSAMDVKRRQLLVHTVWQLSEVPSGPNCTGGCAESRATICVRWQPSASPDAASMLFLVSPND